MEIDAPAFKLRSRIVVGLIGIDGSGAQFLYAWVRSRGLEWKTIRIQGVKAALNVEDPQSPAMTPFMAVNEADVSYLLLNVKLNANACIDFATACLDWIKQHCEEDFIEKGHLILISSLRLKQVKKSKGPFVNHWNVHPSAISTHETLPMDCNISDALLATWLHFATVLQVQTTAIIVSGFRLKLGFDAFVDQSFNPIYLSAFEVVLGKQQILTDTTRLRIEKGAWNMDDSESDRMYT